MSTTSERAPFFRPKHLILIVLCLLPVGCLIAADLEIRGDRHDSIVIAPGFVVVKFKAIASSYTGRHAAATPSTTLARCGVLAVTPMFKGVRPLTQAESRAGRTDISRIALATIPASVDPVTAAAEISQLNEVEYAEPRYSYPLLDAPNDTLLVWQDPYFSRMKLYAAWSIVRGDSSVIIATVDGGTYWKHEDLIANLWVNRAEDINHNGRFDPGVPPEGDDDGIDNDGNGYDDDVIGWNFTINSNDPTGLASQPKNSAHGTATASLFGAVTNNLKGIAGASWNCRLMPICAADWVNDKYITFGPEGMVYAYQNGASVINLSWGGKGTASRALQDVIDAATEAGTLVISSAGNSGSDNDSSPVYPACCNHVLAVGATNSTDDGKAGFSNYGITVPVFASGVDIWSAMPDGSYGNAGSGTSYASPITAGLAGLLKSAHPAWSPAQIATQIRVTADSIDEIPENESFRGKLGRGRVNFGRALSEPNHAGIDFLSAQLHSGRRTVFFSGDSVALSLTVKNVLLASAASLQFTVTSLDSSVHVLRGTSSPITLQPGEEVALPDFTFRIGTFDTSRSVLLRLDWVSNGNDRDLRVFNLKISPVRPVWVLQEDLSSTPLRSVKAVDRDVVWAAGGGSSSVVLRTSNGGVTWLDVSGGLHEGGLNCVEALDSLRAWVGSDSGRIASTTDAGKTWKTQSYPGRQARSICGVKFLDIVNGVALGNAFQNQTQFIVLRTSDGGTTWEHLPSEPADTAGEIAATNAFCWIDSIRGWFGTNRSRVWRTTDGGRSWAARPTGFWVDPPSTAKVFAVDFVDSLFGLAYHPYPYLARSMDGGASWFWVNALLASSPSESEIAFAPGSSWVWAAAGQSILHSTDKGQTWLPESLYPIKGVVSHLSAVVSSLGGNVAYTGWAVTGSGEILSAEYTTTGVVAQQVRLPSSYSLFQNYPNPFNPSTTIKFELPKSSEVRLSVYDILGREVSVLVNEKGDAGVHEVKFDGANLASGVYFYRLQAGDFVQTRKLLILK